MSAPPLIVLGVRRSGTTLLRVMLDGHSQLAVPDESYFVPQLAHRHRDPPDLHAFLDDVRRLPTMLDWGLGIEQVRERLRNGASLGEAIGAIYEAYAASRGKTRWGDKTPMYMQYLGVLERLWPNARYVHLVRDGRDAARSFLAVPAGLMTESWAHPRSAADFACQWSTEVRAAEKLGRRVGPARYRKLRYEQLVEDPEAELRAICEFAELPFEPSLLEYRSTVDVSEKPHQQSLRKPPTPGLRDWRRDMSPADVRAFEGVARDVLADQGYDLAEPAAGRRPDAAGRARLARYRALSTGWRSAGAAIQRSPLWRRRHPPLV